VLHSLYYTSWVPKLHCIRQPCKSRIVTLQGRAISIFLARIKIPPAALTLRYITQNHRQITAPSICKVRYHCFNRARFGKRQSGYLCIQYEWNLLHLGRTGQHSTLGLLPISVACCVTPMNGMPLMLYFFTTHCSLRLIVPSELDVPTFATRRLHACHHARAPNGGKWNCGREISGTFA
jgi:hypothetical protein